MPEFKCRDVWLLEQIQKHKKRQLQKAKERAKRFATARRRASL